ncbi:Flp family type IVb pilin [Emcibacter nanhaiensis]|uniref:Flp family type IVb pilin n=1 Tax=Emcibacter nanhaiensis TaxID=1505037 RepID=A0A501PCT3_9PROT|nr:Flp family type IVb pilin [Emcibacter nanhaiensis]TPD57714.1 Flp family type IVb pilin [Emcibacter nanhaiensis]
MSKKNLSELKKNQKGATAIEYGLLAALITLAAIGGFSAFADSFLNMSNTTVAAVQEVTGN